MASNTKSNINKSKHNSLVHNRTKSVDGVIKSKHSSPKDLKAHRPNSSKTLMRRAVQKPGASLKRQIRAYAATDYTLAKPTMDLVPLKAQLIESSHKHVQHVAKSPLIKHFSKVTPARSIDMLAKPANTMAVTSRQPAIKPAAQIKPMSEPRTSADILEEALKLANGHEQKAPKIKKSRRKRLQRLWFGSVVLLLIIGFGISQNMTNIRLQLAAAKAGFTATLPRQMPSGYSLSQLAVNSGVVATLFHSNSNTNSYKIIQRTSNWDSQSLSENYILPSYHKYSTVATGGLTVYLFGNHDASWVNNGIWYLVDSNGSLSDHQLLDMASSS